MSGSIHKAGAHTLGMSPALHGRGVALAPLRLVANRGIMNNGFRQATAANLTCGETRMNMKTGGSALSEMRFVYCGFYLTNGAGVETNVGNNETIELAVEWPGVGTRRVVFGGANVGTIVNGVAEYVSDPIYPSAFGLANFPANTGFNLRSRRIVALNENHSTHGISGGPGESTFYCDGAPASQLMGTGGMTQQAGGATAAAELGPSAIIGRAVGVPDIAVIAIGDSILNGSNDTNIDGDGSDGGGWVMRAAWSVNSRSVPIMKMSVGGSGAQYMAAGMTKRQAYFKYGTHAICNYGTNDLVSGRTAAQVLADLQTIWAALKTGGLRRVEQALIIPRVTSTDAYVTTANQTPLAGFATNGAGRDPLNNSIISNVGSNGLDAYLNMNPAVADATLLDRWKITGAANYATTDGAHPEPVIHTAMGTTAASRMATWR